MLVVMKAHASEEQVRAVCELIESLGLRAHSIPGAQRTAIGITGNRGEVEAGGEANCWPICRRHRRHPNAVHRWLPIAAIQNAPFLLRQ